MITHVFDLATKLPAHLAIMFSMSWFGIPATDPQGAGMDASYGQSAFSNACTVTEVSAPPDCNNCILLDQSNECAMMGAPQRRFASRRRPLAGIYSSSGLDAESRSRTDLMLSNLRRPGDDGAKIDAWAVQLNGMYGTSLHPTHTQSAGSELTYRATLSFYGEADKAGLETAIIAAEDTTWYFKFGTSVGLGTCDDTTNNPKANCVAALTEDLVDMWTLATTHSSALLIDGEPVLYVYYDPQYLTLAEWQGILDGARNQVNHDFYVIGVVQGGSPDYFPAFDALAPWLQINWPSSSGATVRAHAAAYTKAMAGPIFTAAPSYPGRVAFAGVSPGFDDYTENWYSNNTCTVRELPSSPDTSRDPDFLLGEFDYYRGVNARGVVMQTWDDWTEGTEFEPDVAGGTTMLVSLRGNLGQLFGEPADPVGDARLTQRWMSYGQMRNCSGALVGIPPVVDLDPPDGGETSDGGQAVDEDAGAASEGSGPGMSTPQKHVGGCELGVGPAPTCLGLVLVALFVLRRRVRASTRAL